MEVCFAELQRLGETRTGGTPSRVRQILERIEAAIADTSKDLQASSKANAEFMEIGNRMLQQWEEGVALSLSRPEQTARSSAISRTMCKWPTKRELLHSWT
jgi:hypothetical protein